MKPIDEILLSKREKRLLREIEESEIARNDQRTKTLAFSALIGYDMLELIVSKKFQIEYDMYNNPIPNAYAVVDEVSRYWLYQAEKKSVQEILGNNRNRDCGPCLSIAFSCMADIHMVQGEAGESGGTRIGKYNEDRRRGRSPLIRHHFRQ